MSTLLLGEASCLGAAFLWAFAVAIFRKPIEVYGARAINLVKCFLATLLLGSTAILAGQWQEMVASSPRALLLIGFSGVIGLTMGDTALFAAVARIGPYRTLLLQTLAPIFTALLAFFWSGELLTMTQAAGAGMIMAGIVLVIAGKRKKVGSGEVKAVSIAGIGFGVLSAAGQGFGIVLAKDGLQEVPVLAASFVRLAASTAGLLLVVRFTTPLSRLPELFRSMPLFGRLAGATFIGTYLAMLLMMAGIGMAPAAVAAVLLSMSPVFSMFLDAWMLKEPITMRGLLGTGMAIAGVAVLTYTP